MISVLMGNRLHLYSCFLSQTVAQVAFPLRTCIESTQRPFLANGEAADAYPVKK